MMCICGSSDLSWHCSNWWILSLLCSIHWQSWCGCWHLRMLQRRESSVSITAWMWLAMVWYTWERRDLLIRRWRFLLIVPHCWLAANRRRLWARFGGCFLMKCIALHSSFFIAIFCELIYIPRSLCLGWVALQKFCFQFFFAISHNLIHLTSTFRIVLMQFSDSNVCFFLVFPSACHLKVICL